MSITQTLSNLPTAPSRDDPDNFRTEADAWVDALTNSFVSQLNTIISQFNAGIENLWICTSKSSVAIGTGEKSFVIEEDNFAFSVGTSLRIADSADASSNYMEGVVTAYTESTNTITVQVDTTNGSGTKTAWTITLQPLSEVNRVRKWSNMSGAASIPLIVYHDSGYWVLNANLADVAAKEPGVDNEWDPLQGLISYEEITSSDGSWSPADNATFLFLEIVGAGGGGSNDLANFSVTGGGGGECVEVLIRVADYSFPVSIVIGSGGAGCANGVDGNGSAGGDTSFGDLTAFGGKGGQVNQSGQFIPHPRAKLDGVEISDYPSIGFIVPINCGLAIDNSDYSELLNTHIGGGAGGGSTNNQTGGISYQHGNGGDGSNVSDTAADNGEAPGGGGGASAADGGGGDGARGAVRIWQFAW
jgi:hypothetical protein